MSTSEISFAPASRKQKFTKSQEFVFAQAQFEKLTARKLPLWWRKDGARISRKDE